MKKWSLVVAGVSALILAPTAQAIAIHFDYSLDTSGFFANNATAKSLMEAAGNYWGSHLADNLVAITSEGGNSYAAVVALPSSAGSTTTLENFSVAANTVTVFVSGSSGLGVNVLAQGGPGGYYASGTEGFVNAVIDRGQPSVTVGQGATDFAPWGGSISFNATSAWYFDADPKTSEPFGGSLSDFYSVALHELGHVLGFGTADSWRHWVSNGLFNGPAAEAVHGGAIALSGDSAHWAEATQGLVDGFAQEAAMDPTNTQGTRKLVTDLDLAAMSDIGWQVSSVPVPGAVWLLGSALAVLARRRR